jgi:hypothetical protein
VFRVLRNMMISEGLMLLAFKGLGIRVLGNMIISKGFMLLAFNGGNWVLRNMMLFKRLMVTF